jgi:hypothetical protein
MHPVVIQNDLHGALHVLMIVVGDSICLEQLHQFLFNGPWNSKAVDRTPSGFRYFRVNGTLNSRS